MALGPSADNARIEGSVRVAMPPDLLPRGADFVAFLGRGLACEAEAQFPAPKPAERGKAPCF